MKWYMPLVLIFLSLSSCGNREEQLFTTEHEVRFTVNSGLDNILTHVFVVEDVDNTLEAFANQNNFSLDDISRVNASSAFLEGLFEDGNYSNVIEVAVNIVDSDDQTRRQEIFFQQLIEIDHQGPLNLFGSLGDVKPFMNGESFDIEIEMLFRAPTTRTIENRMIINFVAIRDE